MKINEKLKSFIAEAIKGDGYWVNKAKIAFAVSLEEKRKKAGLNYKDIAEKLGTSSAYMTKVFRGDANLTIETMVKLARASGGQLHIEVADQATEETLWDIPSIKNAGRFHQKRQSTAYVGSVVLVVNNAANHGRFNEPVLLAA